jgi:hypothetical protein
VANPKDGFLVSLGAALLGVLGGALPTGLLVRDAEARIAQPAIRRRDEDGERDDPLLVIAPAHAGSMMLADHSSHRSHSSHSSHSSHYSSSGGGGGRSTGSSYEPAPAYEPPSPPPHHPKPALVSFVASPGGQMFVDGKSIGHDSTSTIKLSAGRHMIRIVNRFVGEESVAVDLSEGQTGVIEIKW